MPLKDELAPLIDRAIRASPTNVKAVVEGVETLDITTEQAEVWMEIQETRETLLLLAGDIDRLIERF